LSSKPADLPIRWPLSPELRNRLLQQFETWGGARPTRDRLVAGLNLAGTRAPLFMVFQEAQEFHKVARVLGPDQPVYAFRSGVRLIDYSEDEIQTFALRYVSEHIMPSLKYLGIMIFSIMKRAWPR
jgi:hypothetical protein